MAATYAVRPGAVALDGGPQRRHLHLRHRRSHDPPRDRPEPGPDRDLRGGPGVYESASSAPLWNLLLGAGPGGGRRRLVAPARRSTSRRRCGCCWTVSGLPALLASVTRGARRRRRPAVVVLGLVPLAMTGMEHTLHAALVAVFLVVLARRGIEPSRPATSAGWRRSSRWAPCCASRPGSWRSPPRSVLLVERPGPSGGRTIRRAAAPRRPGRPRRARRRGRAPRRWPSPRSTWRSASTALPSSVMAKSGVTRGRFLPTPSVVLERLTEDRVLLLLPRRSRSRSWRSPGGGPRHRDRRAGGRPGPSAPCCSPPALHVRLRGRRLVRAVRGLPDHRDGWWGWPSWPPTLRGVALVAALGDPGPVRAVPAAGAAAGDDPAGHLEHVRGAVPAGPVPRARPTAAGRRGERPRLRELVPRRADRRHDRAGVVRRAAGQARARASTPPGSARSPRRHDGGSWRSTTSTTRSCPGVVRGRTVVLLPAADRPPCARASSSTPRRRGTWRRLEPPGGLRATAAGRHHGTATRALTAGRRGSGWQRRRRRRRSWSADRRRGRVESSVVVVARPSSWWWRWSARSSRSVEVVVDEVEVGPDGPDSTGMARIGAGPRSCRPCWPARASRRSGWRARCCRTGSGARRR